MRYRPQVEENRTFVQEDVKLQYIFHLFLDGQVSIDSLVRAMTCMSQKYLWEKYEEDQRTVRNDRKLPVLTCMSLNYPPATTPQYVDPA